VHKTIVAVPCYNEANRLRQQEFLPLLAREGLELLFVDDGSTDDTAGLLRTIQRLDASRIHVLTLRQNGGKAEAVRQGMVRALALGAAFVAYMDADASTPAAEMERLLDAIEHCDVDVVLGARVQLLGSDVRRHRWRHYLGRVFATAASLMLRLPVYDTQCGAKVFRDTPPLRAALREPFHSRWVFDVELLGRLLVGAGTAPLPPERFLEIPLRNWRDVDGSKLGIPTMVRSGAELLAAGARLRRARASRR
jgi:dolichyl-phosphate beta-glucosyltransferase